MLNTLKQFIGRQLLYPNIHIPPTQELKESVIVVTGASRGIGRAIVERLLAGGGKVVAVARRQSSLEEAFASVRNRDSLLLLSADVSLEEDARKIFKETSKTFGQVNALINNAGMNMEKSIEETSMVEFDAMVNTNIRGAFLLSREAVPFLKRSDGGCIINIGSKISRNTMVGAGKSLYALTKYAIEGFSFALNRELKPFGIRVTCLLPGTVNTFPSLAAKKYLSPYQVAEIVDFVLRSESVDFEHIVFKSRRQDNV